MRPTDGARTEASGRGAGRAPRSPRDPPLAGPASLGFWAVTGAVFLPGSLAEGEGRRGLSGSQSLPLVCPQHSRGEAWHSAPARRAHLATTLAPWPSQGPACHLAREAQAGCLLETWL